MTVFCTDIRHNFDLAGSRVLLCNPELSLTTRFGQKIIQYGHTDARKHATCNLVEIRLGKKRTLLDLI